MTSSGIQMLRAASAGGVEPFVCKVYINVTTKVVMISVTRYQKIAFRALRRLRKNRLNAGLRHGRNASSAVASMSRRSGAAAAGTRAPSAPSAIDIAISVDQAHQQGFDARALRRECAHAEPVLDERAQQLGAAAPIAANRERDPVAVDANALDSGLLVQPRHRRVQLAVDLDANLRGLGLERAHDPVDRPVLEQTAAVHDADGRAHVGQLAQDVRRD